VKEEHRKFLRTEFASECYFVTETDKVSLEILNISLKGLLATAKDGPDISLETKGKVQIRLPRTDILLEAHGRIVHKEQDKFGIFFEDIELDSMVHLRRLLELNTGNPNEIERELAFLQKYK
jgi:hypothetical protein